MCGINGSFAYGPSAPPTDEVQLVHVRDRMARRGPDAAGLWLSEDRRVGLGHRRLSIIDLSRDGNQPMQTADGTLALVYNGEIYNYQALRAELESKGVQFRTRSDTEVLLELYRLHGEGMLQKLRGMFALALWDSVRDRLFLARDPFGIKPLYYACDGHTFRFGSQVKALLAGGSINTEPDPAGHVGFLLWGHVPEPFTLYRGIRQLPAGSSMVVEAGRVAEPRAYTSPRDWFATGDTADLREALLDTVRHHFVSDVPVSLFLSAGRDSTTLLALGSEERKEPIHAITLAFPEYEGTPSDETPLAIQVAGLYHAKQTVCRLTREDFMESFACAMDAMDQPSVDGLNTFFVSRAAAGVGVRVALSGLGADELFGGYPSFEQVPRLARALSATRLAPGLFSGLNAVATRAGLARRRPKLASLLEHGGTLEGAYLLRRALYLPAEIEELLEPSAAREGLRTLSTLDRLSEITRDLPSPRAKVSALEMTVYMRDRLLRDSDWAGMAHSLEIRVPFVDRELMRRIGPALAGQNPPNKTAMASTPLQPLPTAILDRAKTGFTVPIRTWTENISTGAGTGDPHRAWALSVYRQEAGDRCLFEMSER